jgi:hypothetical protein
MPISVDFATKVITIPQSDLSLVTGTLYQCDTQGIRLQLKEWEASEDGIIFDDTHIHNTEVTVAGTTFARTIEVINGYSITFEEDIYFYAVRLANSNNNFFDAENNILNQNTVMVIAQNSAGLIVGSAQASAIWGAPLNQYTDSATFGGFVQKLLSFGKWLSLRGGTGK